MSELVGMNSDLAECNRHDVGEYHVVGINTEKARYKRKPWKELNAWEKRKFENLIFLKYPKRKLKVIYYDE